MVLSEVENASPGSLTDAHSTSGSGSSDNFPDDNGNIRDSPERNWTVDSIKSLISQHQVYPDPFTPIPFYARMMGWSAQERNESLANNVNRTQTYIARQLTPTEVQAEAYYHSVLLNSIYRSEAIGLISLVGLAAVRQNAGRPGLITPYAQKYLGKVAGDWYIRLSRYGVYGFFGRLQGQFFGAILGANSMKEHMKQDPNVQALRRDLSEFRQWSEDEIRRRAADRKRGVKEPLLPSMEEIKNRPHPNHPHPNPHHEPTEVADDGSFNTSAVDDASPATGKLFPELNPLSNRQPSHAATTTTTDDPLYGIIPPSGADTSSGTTTTSSSSGGSAWERLRRQQQPQTAPTPTSGSSTHKHISPWVVAAQARTDTDPRIPKTDSFTFSTSDQERQLAQIEAQKEFDARVERERSGGSERGFMRQGSDESMAGRGTEADYSGRRGPSRNL